jgi:cbb3-type cytochrome oxidase subunit 3
MNMDLNDVRSLVTLLGLSLFLGLMVWIWWPSRRDAFDAAAMLPFDGETPAANKGVSR